jgi:hypothetical protein
VSSSSDSNHLSTYKGVIVRKFVIAGMLGAGIAASLVAMPAAAFAAEPTCTEQLGTQTHGEHVLYDYIIGVGRDSDVSWPPSGGIVGHVLLEAGGALVPGAPGPVHMSKGFAPGASFCTGSSSPGTHL